MAYAISIEQVGQLWGAEAAESAAKHREGLEKRRWRGIRLQLRPDGSFYVGGGWEVRTDLKAMGFRWNAASSTWDTTDEQVASKLCERAVGPAKEKLVPHSRMRKADATFERAATRLEAGDEERVRAALTPAVAAAIRQAVAVLAACDGDKATVINKKGFSKADTELGHTLHLSGVRTYREAALALKLTWRYRGQLPEAVVTAAFPVHGHEHATLTREQAEAVVSYFADEPDAALDQLEANGALLPAEPTVAYGFPGEQQTRTRIAAVERGRSLYYVEQDGGARHWLEVA